jgi:hypothetical protein
MRDLQVSDKNVLEIFDTRSGTEMEIYYRTPTSKEEALYQARLVKRKGRKVILMTHATRVKFGRKIITGFKEGDFGIEGKPFSTDPESAIFREDWKELLEKTASDILNTLAFVVFEGARPDAVGLDETDEDDEVLEETAPLEKS